MKLLIFMFAVSTISPTPVTEAADDYAVEFNINQLVANNDPQRNFTVEGFAGLNVGIGSWFVSNSTRDSTNGNSWCGYKYSDKSIGFAPDIDVMTRGTGAVWGHPLYPQFAEQYCGLEARVTSKENNRTGLFYIIDAFDHKWVKTKGSIDIMIDSWSYLMGRPPTDKNDIIWDVEWEFTTKRSENYCYKCQGDT